MKTMRDHNLHEKIKYETIWKEHEYESNTAFNFATYLKDIVIGRCLDLGCGNGTTVLRLRDLDIDCHGVDITLAGVPDEVKNIIPHRFHEAPIWQTKFKPDLFQYSFSTDVMEHIPTEMVPRTIREISRITTMKTIHQICTRDAVKNYSGYKVHLTVRDIDWWEFMFKKYCIVPYELKEI